MNGTFADLRHAVRHYAATPASSMLALVILAVAMSCIASMLTLWTDLSLKPHPGFERSRELVTLDQTDGTRHLWFSLDFVEAVRESSTSLTSIAGVRIWPMPAVLDGRPEQSQVELVTRGFSELGPYMAMGRRFDAADHAPGAAPTAILSHRFWQEKFGGRQAVIGEAIHVMPPSFLDPRAAAGQPSDSGTAYRIVGILAPRMTGILGTETDLLIPFESAIAAWPGGSDGMRSSSTLRAIGRPARGASLAAVRAELEADRADYSDLLRDSSGRMEVRPGVIRDIGAHLQAEGQVLLFLGGSVLLVLLAASNISLFLLSRAPSRKRELAIRVAVGATWKRLALQLGSEAGLLVGFASALGVVVSLWLAAVLRDSPILSAADWRDVSVLDWRVLALVGIATLIVTLLVSVAPILALKRVSIEADTRVVSARAGSGQRVAATIQLAAIGPLAGAALGFAWHLADLVTADHGFDATDVHVATVRAQERMIVAGGEDSETLMRRLRDERERTFVERDRRRPIIGSLPGIAGVAFGTGVPGRTVRRDLYIVPTPNSPEDRTSFGIVSAGVMFPELLGMVFVSGRGLESDSSDEILINETLANQVWGTTDVVGELLFGDVEVVGVVRDIAYGGPSSGLEPLAYRRAVSSSRFDSILLESPLSSTAVARLLQDQIDAGALGIELESVEPLAQIWRRTFAADNARTTITIAAAVIGILIAAFGIYSTQSYLLASGNREYAIHSALGAGPRALGRLVALRTLIMGLPGIVFGSLLCFIAVAWLSADYLSGVVSPAVATIIVTLIAICMVVVASIRPMQRARRTVPGQLLRQG